MLIRIETKKALLAAKSELKRLLIQSYIADGWDLYWSYPDRPKWLGKRYSPVIKTKEDPG